ncbi:hypothetical protein ColTof4_05168 [Colletotrichum tofieldiae]|uniref:Uncharacterized protein n=1 Tax=Colletotrichum tofieldiae TaxID=708197 RepID=A0A166PFN4_9PEZI|nr:hypothetical protein CT0861_00550 [Colletotrichum tofieldiae]GKT63245.1 hypothetical protein ColTof3_10584 [Colletotrichum tofieldiae]GKT72745.1 hypothetical protein ColTof4_05168 [Colletotrichum tofieldiae]GKT89414.1 hypothetical protein Ct61P_07264 [Colletotrichum tofieldiae]
MDPIPVPGAAPAAAGVDKVPETVVTTTSAETKPAEPVAAETKPAEEKKDENKEETAPAPETSAAPIAEPAKLEEPPALVPPADAPAAADTTGDAPKPASVEEVPDQDGPAVTTGVQESKAIPAEQPAVTSAPAAEPVKESVEEPIAQESAKAPVVEDETIKEPITEKVEAVNGATTKDVEMTGALNDAEPAGTGEREAAPQAIPSEAKAGDKRKADDVFETNGANGTNGVEEAVEEKPAEKKAKRGPGRPPSNGAAKESPKKDSPSKEKESFGHKVARNVKKVIHPVGRTARKTRSQGPV